MNGHAPRPVACHDTTELQRHERGERFAWRLMWAVGLVVAGFAAVIL